MIDATPAANTLVPSEWTLSRAVAAPLPTPTVGARALLALIRERPRTRADLAERTALTRSAVAKRLDSLSEMGLITFDVHTRSTGGRPPEMLTFNAAAGLVLAGELQPRSARLALADLGGTVLLEREEPFDLDSGPDAAVDWVAQRGRTLLADAGHPLAGVSTIAISVPGLVDPVRGRIVDVPSLADWHGFPLAEALAEQCRVPAIVDTDVNLMTIGEQRRHWSDQRDLIFVKIDSTIAAGILVAGRLMRGAHGSAGDIAHVQVPGYEEFACACGGQGCLAAFASGQALVRRLNESGVPTSSEMQIRAHIAAGIPQAIVMARDAGRAIGAVLSAVVNTVNPSTLVLGGSMTDIGAPLIAAVRAEIYRRSRAVATQELRVAFSSTWKSAAIVGAAWLAVEHLLAPDPLDADLLSLGV